MTPEHRAAETEAREHVHRLVMWVDVVEEIHGEFKGGLKAALEEARDFLAEEANQ